jgi:hypothetical protein
MNGAPLVSGQGRRKEAVVGSAAGFSRISVKQSQTLQSVATRLAEAVA